MKSKARSSLRRLRQLRDQVDLVNEPLVRNLRPFLHPNKMTFAQTPKTADEIEKQNSRPDDGKIDASTTSTVLMALALGDELHQFYDTGAGTPTLSAVVSTLYEEKWTSVGLKDFNFFTAALVFRALGFLCKYKPALKDSLSQSKHQGQTYADLVARFGEMDPSSGKVGGAGESSYPLTPTLVYWLLDAADKLSWSLTPGAWERWGQWAAEQFHRQFSYVTAQDDASMDPVALAMSACLAARIRRIAESGGMGSARRSVEQILPSWARLKVALPELFARQGKSGIWPKYFPLFVYPGEDALINHCFAFELLEALLTEFPKALVSNHFRGLAKSVAWCEQYWIQGHLHKGDSKEYCGWNSGSNLKGLTEGNPECWATGVVHMFLFKLKEVLSKTIQDSILGEYGAQRPVQLRQKRIDEWTELVGSHLSLAGVSRPIKAVLDEEILKSWSTPGSDPRKRKRSALLFGPPGTSKTTLVRRLAAVHDWPCISVNPSHFLKDGLERIFGRANEIFEDLMDLSNVVVFFDEMDPLVQKREAESDIHHQSLTTVFLPKLADLYNQNALVFFMATNHIQQIDPAIRRPGRFDYLLFVGPPRWQDKYRALTRDGRPDQTQDHKDASALLEEWTKAWLLEGSTEAENVAQILDRFTFDETKALFDQVERLGGGSLYNGLNGPGFGLSAFRSKVIEWSQNYIVLWERDGTRADDYDEYLKDRKSSR